MKSIKLKFPEKTILLVGIRKSGRRSTSHRGNNRSRVRKLKSRRSKSDEYEYKAILANIDKFSRRKELAIKEKEKRELERLEHIMLLFYIIFLLYNYFLRVYR